MKSIIVMCCIVLLSCQSASSCLALTQIANNIPKTVLEINNPFNIDIGLSLKCNWIGGKFKYVRSFVIKGRSRYKLDIPRNSKCQIWPWLR